MKEEMLTINEIRIWVSYNGKGIPVMLCGGGPGLCDYLAPVAGMIKDAEVFRFEQRGCGRSDATPPYDLQTTIADLDSIRKHFDLDQWIIGGHSWGANVALTYALEHPENTKAIIYISGPGIQNNREWKRAYAKGMANKGEFEPEYQFPFNPEVNRQGNLSWRKYIRKPDLLAKISSLDIPALIVYGEQDIRPSWPAEQLVNLLPKAKYILVKGAQHFIWLTHSDQLKNHLRDFIQEVIF